MTSKALISAELSLWGKNGGGTKEIERGRVSETEERGGKGRQKDDAILHLLVYQRERRGRCMLCSWHRPAMPGHGHGVPGREIRREHT